MSRIESEIWERLDQARPTGDNLSARPATPGVTARLLCGLDSEGMRHLLIALQTDEQELRDTRSRGVSVVTSDLAVRGHAAARYIDVQCVDAAGHAAFDLIGGELAEELAHPGNEPAGVVRRVLARWRRFWGQLPQSLLRREELLGLFGELWILSSWFLPCCGVAEAVQRWRGPFGARHDFEWQSKSVEVKTTTSERGRIHHINGLDQLSPPEQGDLLFFSLRLREEAGATNTLPSLIADTRRQLESDDEALSRFETALAQVGYFPVHDEEYSRVHLRVVEEGLYAVQADFPRLTPSQFPTDVPAGVERVEYEINLNTFDHLCVAQSPEEAEGHLN
ncbi:MAG: PD-(D/E)XK motif protein [Candidatus Binatia bacterium]